MSNPQILFLDVDGTLVDYRGNLPQSAVAAIRAARARGHRVYICTGRSKAEVYPDIWAIGLDGMIGGNGAYVEDGGRVVLHRHITREQCGALVDWLHRRGLAFYLESNSGLYASEDFAEAGLAAIRAYAAGKGRADAETMTLQDAFPDMIFGCRGQELVREDVNKISFVLGSLRDYRDAAAAFPQFEVHTWGGQGEHPLFGDFGVKGIDKAVAVRTLVAHLGAEMADTIAFGDASIDIPMFEICGRSCCMGSGGEAARAAADYVTTAVDRDGLYNAFAHFGLLGEEKTDG